MPPKGACRYVIAPQAINQLATGVCEYIMYKGSKYFLKGTYLHAQPPLSFNCRVSEVRRNIIFEVAQ